MFSSNTSQVSNDANYIEDVFSTWLYTGNGDTQPITNGIDLANEGGLVWAKARPRAGDNHEWRDTVRGGNSRIFSNNTNAASSTPNPYTFNADGYTIGGDGGNTNENGITYVSWTFRKQKKFFDVVTWTGDGTDGRQIPHSLGAVPGCIIIKNTSNAASWQVYHRGNTAPESNWWDNLLILNATNASASFPNTLLEPTSTNINLEYANVNASGQTYVAYLFAHNAGGFGLTGTDNVISCGSYTGNGSTTGPVITLGYEPQWLLVKKSSGAGDWVMVDNMRGIITDGVDPRVWANLSSAENTGDYLFKLNATGFQPESLSDSINASGQTYIYIAIRRGPMKVPTDATTVFNPVANSSAIDATTPVSLNPPASDLWFSATRSSAAPYTPTRLTGWGYMRTSATAAEDNTSYTWTQQTQSNLLPSSGWWSAVPQINYFFKRAPSFFDVVCYTGTGSGTKLLYHNLGVSPELVIIKRRDSASDWMVNTLTDGSIVYSLGLNSTSGDDATSFQGTAYGAPTYIGVRTGSTLANISGATYVAYLFATCAGVSKVGSYTGDGTTNRVINCGFTSGARFVMLKKTSTTSSWYVYDTARGIVSGGEASLSLNTTAAESGSADVIDPDSTGFSVGTSASDFFNESGVSYIFLAIA